jgi:hypothetical protein
MTIELALAVPTNQRPGCPRAVIGVLHQTLIPLQHMDLRDHRLVVA